MTEKKDIRVLIAEDDYLVGETIKGLLDEIGYIVVGKATNGRQVVEMATRFIGTPEQPDVILMDVKMPDIDGIEAIPLIQEKCPTPIVVLTAYESPDLVAEVSAAGAGAYLVKPPVMREMERAITIAIARFQDMVALRKINRQLEEALIELKAAQEKIVKKERLAAVGQLAAGIAHEFNNIMASIILYSDMMLANSDLSPTDHKKIATIQQQGQRAAHFTQQILDFGRKTMLKREDVDLVTLIQELIGVMENNIPEDIRLHLSSGVKGMVANVDSTRINQAIMNLILNASDSMPEGGEVFINLDWMNIMEGEESPLPEMQPGKWARIMVMDNGNGIAPDVFPHIFEPFFTTMAPLRSGLGLSQAYGILKQHDGFIDVVTEKGRGTTVSIYLPTLAVSQIKMGPLEQPEIIMGNKETILLLENNLIMREAIVASLKMLNYHVLPTGDGSEIFTLLEGGTKDGSQTTSENIALLLCDLRIPEMDGMALCRKIRRNYPGVKIVVLADYPQRVELEELKGHGIDGWLQKPLNLAQLAKTISQALT